MLGEGENTVGLFKFVRSRLIDKIEWTDNRSQSIVCRFPAEGRPIKMGAELTVRESQAAILVNEGKIADVFGPGRYVLTAESMPRLAVLKSWKYKYSSPFQADVYFVNTRQIAGQQWSTINPIALHDPDFGLVQLRAHGTFTFKVADAEQFLKEIFATNEIYDTAFITGQLKSYVVSGLSDMLGEAGMAAQDLGSRCEELSEMTENRLQNRFARIGLEISSLIIEDLLLPDDVQQTIGERAAPGGEKSDGGDAGEAQDVPEGAAESGESDERVGTSSRESCSSCGYEVQADMKFCPECGTALKKQCASCGHDLGHGMKYCPECGTKA